MRLWPFPRRRTGCPSEDAVAADHEAARALTDAKALTSRADDVSERLAKRRARNGFTAAILQSIRGA